jgi:3-deoxy-D-manno-octulosonic-acid transferase
VKTLYTLLLRLLLPFVLARLWWRGRAEPLYREALGERFGHYDSDRPEKLIWIHAVSVGEARAAAPLVRALEGAVAEHRMLMTCTTAAGRETIKQLYGESVLEAYLPYDLPEAVQRFLEYYRPRLGILMETELWPNLLAQCSGHGVPMLLANARLSVRSARGYRRWGALARPAIGALAAVCAQTAEDAARLSALGARNVEVTGNLKFDVEPDAAQLAAGRAWRVQLGRPVVLLASTREGEEKLLLDALPPWDGKLLVLVVPRHPQRFDEAARLTEARRSQSPLPDAKQRTYLGDTMGEMAFYYAACDIAVIGGSFARLGGQNLIEALAAGAPVVTGPSMYNFAEATRLAVAAGAAIQAADAQSAIRTALELIADPAQRQAMSQAGRKLCEMHRGATERHLRVCLALLKTEFGL